MTKKNSTFKFAGILLILVLMTSCFVGGTFAKYATAGNGTDSARVAKFGVTITANGTTFAKEYAANSTSEVGTMANSVVSTDKVIAPGTSGNMVSMNITGAPEVAVMVGYEATVDLGDNWKDANGEFYCPLVVTVSGVEISGKSFDSADGFESVIQQKIEACSKKYDAREDLSSVTKPSVSWKWAFEGDDVKDTYLGDQAAAGEAAKIDLTIKTTVTQID